MSEYNISCSFYVVFEHFSWFYKSNSDAWYNLQALVPEKVKKAYRDRVQKLNDPLMVLDLYFCGTLEHPERIKEILKGGFSERGNVDMVILFRTLN